MKCESCGAPADGKDLICGWCKRPVSAELMRTAIACPQCRTPNIAGSPRCCRCGAWCVVACVFCGALSAYTAPACTACREPFAGAMQRKAARDAELRRQQDLQVMGAVGSVAAPLLGALAGSLLEGVFSHHAGGAVNAAMFTGDEAPFGHVPHDSADGGSSSGDSSAPIAEIASSLLDGGGDADS